MGLYKKCILILADGARPDLFQQLLKAGALPTIQKELVEKGGFRTALSAFPSTTGPAYMPFVNGCYPGTCNVPGIRWFNKDVYARKLFSRKRFRSYVGFESYLMGSDMTPGLKTIFHLIPNSVNIFSPINKGVSFRGNRSKFWRIWYWYYAYLTDHWTLIDKAAREKLLRAIQDDVEFIFAVLPGVDEYSHIADPFHEQTIKSYQVIDDTVGEVIHLLRKRGEYEETLIMIVSDHGLSSTHTHFGLGGFLESTGRKTFYYPKIFKTGFEAASMISGNGMGHVYFKGPHGWAGRLNYPLLKEVAGDVLKGLISEESVDLVTCQEAQGKIRVMSRRGQAVIAQEEGHIRYEVLDQDPFDYPPLPEIMTDREGLERTYESRYPDALAQLLQIFHSPRTGDLVISAKRGHDLRRRFESPEHKASHGSLDREHMAIPFCSNLPKTPQYIRSVDVFSTLVEALGRRVPPGIDGRSFFSK